MSGVSQGLTLPQALNLSAQSYKKLLQANVTNVSRANQAGKVRQNSNLVRAELIHLGNIRTRAVITSRNVQIQDDLIQKPKNVIEEKNQKKQNIVNQTVSKITDKLTSLFSKKNFLTQGTHQIQSSTTVTDTKLANQNVYPLAGNIAASTDTNIALSLQAGQTPSQAAVNIINISAPELAQQLPVALDQSIKTLNKMGEKFGQLPINASLL